jgi:hypothetical protein
MVGIKEVTHEKHPTVVFELELYATNVTDDANFKGFTVYRSFRIPDLYGRPTNPAADPTMLLNGVRQRSGFQASRPSN